MAELDTKLPTSANDYAPAPHDADPAAQARLKTATEKLAGGVKTLIEPRGWSPIARETEILVVLKTPDSSDSGVAVGVP